MSISIPHLAIEVTRRCNIQCNHCLRGDIQNKNIPLEYIDNLLDQIHSIGHFCPTGGEPSLNVPAIKYFIDGCKKRNITIESFYIATNGINLKQNFVDICLELHEMVIFKFRSSIQISNDLYHNEKKMYNDNLLKDLSFYSKRCSDDWDDLDGGNKLHREGKSENDYSAKTMSAVRPLTSVESFNSNPIYLNVEGNIINGCDWSYSNQNSHILCNVKEIEKFKNNLIEEEFINNLY